MRDSFLKNILVNIRSFFAENIRKRINRNASEIAELKKRMEHLESENKWLLDRVLCHLVLDYYAQNPKRAEAFGKELDFLKVRGEYVPFPYENADLVNKVVADMDINVGLPYVVHNGKRLYFPKAYGVTEAVRHYKYLMNTERLLGTDDNVDAPHQYQSDRIQVEDGDVVFDIGAAEGLFALDHIDQASHVVLVECEPKWMDCLNQTFSPYGDKVVIVNRMLSGKDTEKTVSLPTLLTEYHGGTAFVKMDIEGTELPMMKQAVDFLGNSDMKLKFSLASYHKQNDSMELKRLFDDLGYYSEFSEGYMLFDLYDKPQPPYFRKGVIRAKSLN